MIQQTTISFPEIKLPERAAHQNIPKLRYAYSLVQYKVINNTPYLIGLGEGADLLVDLFLEMKSLDLNGQHYPIQHKQIEVKEVSAGYSKDLHTYEFKTLWMGLNQKNYPTYKQLADSEKKKYLQKILTGHILGFCKGMDIWLESHQHIMLNAQLTETMTSFKNTKMSAFKGQFTTNVLLPNWVGLGKSVARGFGTIQQVQ